MTANRRDGFLKQLLAFVLLLLLVLPFLQKQFGFINEKKLFGSFGQAQAAGGTPYAGAAGTTEAFRLA
ncbi:MAG TPA: hypothetical protein PK855_01135 [Bacteroidales bacterium]|nr:hypothetical protein [Bacteroidales bacterium]